MEDFGFGLETRELEARGLDLDLEEEDDLFEGLEEDLDEEPLFGAIVKRVARVLYLTVGGICEFCTAEGWWTGPESRSVRERDGTPDIAFSTFITMFSKTTRPAF